MIVRELELEAGEDRVARWDGFVAASPEATFFHRAAWRTVLRQAFGHRPYFLYAESDGEIRGVLPLAHQPSLLFGDALISTPFCAYGGVVALDLAAQEALEGSAVELAKRLDVGYIEFRNQAPRRDDWIPHSTFATFRREISNDAEANLLAIPATQRAEVRKGIDLNLLTVASRDADDCWALYAKRVHRLGSPVVARPYFRDLARAFGTDCEFFFILRGGVPVASLLNFYFRDQVLPYYTGSAGAGPEAEVRAFMTWSLMNHAASRGARMFDFGRSPVGSADFAFKQEFGFEAQPLAYEVKLVRATRAPDPDPESPRHRRRADLWKQLPLWLANVAGPWAARQMG